MPAPGAPNAAPPRRPGWQSRDHEKQGDDGDQDALERLPKRNVGEWHLGEAGSMRCDVDRQIERQGSGRDQSNRVERVELGLAQDHGEARPRGTMQKERSAWPNVRVLLRSPRATRR